MPGRNYILLVLFSLIGYSAALSQSVPPWAKIVKDTIQADTLSVAERIFLEEAGAALGLATPQIMEMIGGIGGVAGLIAKPMGSDDHKAISQIKAVDKKRGLFEKYRKRLERGKLNEFEYRYLLRSLMEIPTSK